MVKAKGITVEPIEKNVIESRIIIA